MKLQRYPGNPILKPNPLHEWESLNVFNAAVVYHNGLFHMLYRAQGLDYVSRIGYALSPDGFNWWRLDRPVFEPEAEYETRGVEDPRITPIGDTFYMVYVGYSPRGTRVCLASTKNFLTWKRYGAILPEWNNKDATLFPEKIKGRYCLIHRIPDDIWIAYSDDLKHWSDYQIIMKPRPGHWDSVRIGAAGPPLKTEKGWLFFYHAFDEKKVYRLGAVLLDLEDPGRVIRRPKEFILEPEETWEVRGDVPNVVFSGGAVEVNGRYYVFYGGADRVMAVATVSKEEMLDFLS